MAAALQLAQFVASVERTIAMFQLQRSGSFRESYTRVNFLSTISADYRRSLQLGQNDGCSQANIAVCRMLAIFQLLRSDDFAGAIAD